MGRKSRALPVDKIKKLRQTLARKIRRYERDRDRNETALEQTRNQLLSLQERCRHRWDNENKYCVRCGTQTPEYAGYLLTHL